MNILVYANVEGGVCSTFAPYRVLALMMCFFLLASSLQCVRLSLPIRSAANVVITSLVYLAYMSKLINLRISIKI